MFRRGLINITNTNGCQFVFIFKHNISSVRSASTHNLKNKKYFCAPNICIYDFKNSQKRFCSSSVASSLNKVVLVNAAPLNTEVGSKTNSDSSEFIHVPEEPTAAFDDSVITYIPPPPVPPDVLEVPLNALGEPTLSSLGLGGWSPIGLLQNVVEFFHVSLDIPWWGAIAITTLILRLCLFPVVILSQKNAVKMNNSMPKIQELNKKMTDARASGNNLEASRLAYEVQEYMKKDGINPLKFVLVPLLQAPIFMSMFLGLRRCSNLPVESFQTGGMLWFTDLTVSDPYYLLPVITSLTLLATIEVGAEGRPMVGPHAQLMKYVLRGLPIIMFPFVITFPSSILCYWVCTNFFSLGQVAFLRIPAVRTYFKIGEFKVVPKSKEVNKGFMNTVKSSWSNMKVASQVQDRHKIDEIRFKKAGTGPLVKTYKQNPLTNRSVPSGGGLINVKTKTKA